MVRSGFCRLVVLLGLLGLLGIGRGPGVLAVQAADRQLVPVMVHLDLPPLGLVGRSLTPEQRRSYAQSIQSAQDAAARQVAALGGNVVRRFSMITSGLLAQLPASSKAQLAQSAGVLKVSQISDYKLSQETGSLRSAAQPRLQFDGQGTSIAIIDSGIDYTHLAFGGPGTVAAYDEAYLSKTTIGDSPYFPGPRVKGGYDYVGEEWPNGALAPDPDPIDAEGHGTAVADIAAGSAPGAAGVAPAAAIYAFKACAAHSERCNGPAVLQAIEDALDLDRDLTTYDPATVIVLAFSSAYGQPEDDLSYYVDIAASYGSVVVASAGNSGDLPYSVGAPSTASGAISVGQSGSDGQQPVLAATTSRGPRINDGRIKPDLLATGGSNAALVGSGSGRAAFGGASSAVPLVAGAVALLAQKYGDTLNPAAYRALLMNTANPLVTVSGGGTTTDPASIGLRASQGLNAVLGSSNFARAPRLVVTCADGQLQVLDPTADTFVEEAKPSASYGGLNYLRVRDDRKLAGEMFSLLRFPPPSCTAQRAELQLDIAKFYPPKGGRLLAFAATSRWNEQTTWRNRPALGAAGGTITVNTSGLYSLDVSNLLRDRAINIALRSDGLLSVELKSREVNAPPRLLVRCNDGSGQLLDLSADTFVRQDTPTLAWGQFSALRVADSAQAARITLLRFPAASCSPQRARLEFQVRRLLSGAGAIEATQIVGAWDEATTWSNRPTLAGSLGQVAVSGAGVYSVDVSGVLSGQVSTLAPITRQGAGQLDMVAASAAQTIAWDDEAQASSPVYSQTASLSFGFRAVDGQTQLTRRVRVRNLGDSQRTYALSAALRYADDADKGVRISVAPESLSIPAQGEATFSVTLAIDAVGLRPWTLNAGELGNVGSAFGSNAGPISPSLTLFEYDGLVTVDGGAQNIAHVPWQVLPRRSADVHALSSTLNIAPGGSAALMLDNRSATTGDVEAFALMELSPDIYTYTVGSLLGQNYTLIDIKQAGVRGRTTTAGTPLVEFAATIYDRPFRAAQYPVQMVVLVDSNHDGSDDYQVFTDDAARNGSDGRNAVFVRRLPDGEPAQIGFVDRDFNSQNWILPVPAAAIGVAAGSPFSFRVLVSDNAFPPREGEVYLDSTARLTYQLDAPAFEPAALTSQVAPNVTASLGVRAPASGSSASPGQLGLLLLYRHALVGGESEAILINR